MTHIPPKPGNHIRTGKYDAYIIPDPEISDASFELTLLDREIPAFDPLPVKPGRQPPATTPLPGHNDQNRPNLPSYATGGASGFIAPKSSTHSLQTPAPSKLNDTPESFEILPDYTRDRSFRHYDVAPQPLPKAPADTEVHIPVADMPPPEPIVILKNDLSSYWKQPSTTSHTISADTAPLPLPISKEAASDAVTLLPQPATRERPAGNTLPTHPGSTINFYRHDTTSRIATSPRVPVENRQVEPPAELATATPLHPAEELLPVPTGLESDPAMPESAVQTAAAPDNTGNCLHIDDSPDTPFGPDETLLLVPTGSDIDIVTLESAVQAAVTPESNHLDSFQFDYSTLTPFTPADEVLLVPTGSNPDTTTPEPTIQTASALELPDNDRIIDSPVDLLADTLPPPSQKTEPSGAESELQTIESAAQAVSTQPPPAETRLVDHPVELAESVIPEPANPVALDDALRKLIHTIPLLSEDDLLTSLAEPQYGGFTISLKTLKQALIRTDLETDYKRYRAYITG